MLVIIYTTDMLITLRIDTPQRGGGVGVGACVKILTKSFLSLTDHVFAFQSATTEADPPRTDMSSTLTNLTNWGTLLSN